MNIPGSQTVGKFFGRLFGGSAKNAAGHAVPPVHVPLPVPPVHVPPPAAPSAHVPPTAPGGNTYNNYGPTYNNNVPPAASATPAAAGNRFGLAGRHPIIATGLGLGAYNIADPKPLTWLAEKTEGRIDLRTKATKEEMERERAERNGGRDSLGIIDWFKKHLGLDVGIGSLVGGAGLAGIGALLGLDEWLIAVMGIAGALFGQPIADAMMPSQDEEAKRKAAEEAKRKAAEEAAKNKDQNRTPDANLGAMSPPPTPAPAPQSPGAGQAPPARSP